MSSHAPRSESRVALLLRHLVPAEGASQPRSIDDIRASSTCADGASTATARACAIPCPRGCGVSAVPCSARAGLGAPVVVGAMVLDVQGRAGAERALERGTTTPGQVHVPRALCPTPRALCPAPCALTPLPCPTLSSIRYPPRPSSTTRPHCRSVPPFPHQLRKRREEKGGVLFVAKLTPRLRPAPPPLAPLLPSPSARPPGLPSVPPHCPPPNLPTCPPPFPLPSCLPPSRRAQVEFRPGGVARNIGECMAALTAPPLLISAVGDDAAGRSQCCSHPTHALPLLLPSIPTTLIPFHP
ncbi:unnamed protein product [Closterium sp. NIES-54]